MPSLKYLLLSSLLFSSVAQLQAQPQTDSTTVSVDKAQRRGQEALVLQMEAFGSGLHLSDSQQAAILATLAQLQMEINNVNSSNLGKAKFQARQVFADTAMRQIRQQLTAAQQSWLDLKHPDLATSLFVQ